MVGMEAAAVSAASGMLKIVGNKLALLVINQYRYIVGVTKDLQELQDLVEEINCWLETVGDEAMQNNLSFSWLKQLKDVTYTIDDLVDEFYLEAEKHDSDGDGGKLIGSRYTCRKPKSFLFRYGAAWKIKGIKKRFATIVKQRTDLSTIVNSLPVGHSVIRTKRTTGETPSLPVVDEESVLGRDQEKRQLISKLVESNNQHRIVIVSIIGLGGSGKTTLAKLVFNDGEIIGNHFEVRLWVHVSQEFDVAKLVEKLFEAIAGAKSEHYPLQQMSRTISNKLAGKMFLLVLDDVWTEDQIHLEQFMVHMKSGAPGSRILLTTRNRRVAEAMESTCQFDLAFLSEADSWRVFKQSFGMAGRVLDYEFREVGKEIVNKCGGVPLAVKVLAGVLREKKHIKEWQAIRDNNLLDAEGKEHRVSACLRLSYFHLPSHLKQCFTICSVFPKGHTIDKEQLIDQWIAHDMITPLDGVDYLEHSGSVCFDSLVQVSFLQNVVQRDNGKVECNMHDLIHDLARSILGDEMLLDVPLETAKFKKGYRYFSVTEPPRNLLPNNVFEKTRAMYVSAGGDIIFGKSLKKAKHLRSITLDSVSTTSVPTAMLHIKNLKYLNISGLKCESLPEAITNIWSLQALHVVGSPLLELPQSIGKLQKLRAINLSYCFWLKCLPDSIGDCHMISTLDLHSCWNLEALPNSIIRNKRLRVLRLGLTAINRLPSGITTLKNLECLDLQSCLCLEELPESIVNLKNLEVLNLRECYKLKSIPVGIAQLSRLHKLGLFVVGEGENSARISELGNLSWIGGDLTIKNITCRMDPVDAQMAFLKRKTNLQRLTLTRGIHGEVNDEKEEVVLDCLEPPSEIKGLEIFGFERCARWLLNQFAAEVQVVPKFPSLTILKLSSVIMKHLDGLAELPCLRELELTSLWDLESISGGPFPLLVSLCLVGMYSLGDLWLMTEGISADGEEVHGSRSNNPELGQPKLQIGSCLANLTIDRCPKLVVKPYLPLSLENLHLKCSNEQLLLSPRQGKRSTLSYSGAGLGLASFSWNHLELQDMTPSAPPPDFKYRCGWELLQQLMRLESLHISCCNGLTQLPYSMRSLKFLQSLRIEECSALCILPEWLGELHALKDITIRRCDSLSNLPPSVQHLTTLQTLELSYCTALTQLPECLAELRSLHTLRIQHLPNLSNLPRSLENLTSLQKLEIVDCDAFHQLPDCLGALFSLRIFEIGCLHGLTCLPQSMCRLTSLEMLTIWGCPGIMSLPDWIKGLTTLQELYISDCPDLVRRCKRGEGVDWHLISHVPCLRIP